MNAVPKKNAKQAIRANIDWVRYLPDGEFTRRDVDDATPIRHLRQIGIVHQLETEREGNIERSIFALTERARQVQGEVQRDPMCSCGHNGLEDHGDYHACAFELCDRRFSRDEVAP